MTQLPQPRMPRGPYRQGPQPMPVQPRPRRPRPRRLNFWQRMHWGWILAPLLLVLAAWLATGVEVGVTWNQVMDMLAVHNKEAYTRLALLGLLVVAFVAVAKILREQHEDRK